VCEGTLVENRSENVHLLVCSSAELGGTQPACLLTQRLGSLFSSRKDSLVNMAMRVGINGFGRIGACHYTQARCARLPALPREPVDRAMGRLHSPPADRRTAWRAGSSQIP
jgi:hypothetical protein